MALERLQAIQYESATSKRGRVTVDPEVGCDWYINSAEHDFCFWGYVTTVDRPVPDKEICQLLNITQVQLRETYSSAIKKLQAMKDDQSVQDFMELVLSKVDNEEDASNFLISESVFATPKEDTDETEEEMKSILQKKKKGRKIRNGMPVHRDGKKMDLFGLYSRKKDD